MTRFLLVSRSAEYEARLGALLGDELLAVAGERLTSGAASLLKTVPSTPHVALLGPVLSYDETRLLVRELTERYPGIGIIVVREQRADLEDWVDGMELHAVLAPDASDEVARGLFARLLSWLESARGLDADRDDWGLQSDYLEGAEARLEVEDVDASETEGTFLIEEVEEERPSMAIENWLFPAELAEGSQTDVIAVIAPKGGQGKTSVSINLAVLLARVAPNSVVLVDADMQFGDIATALDLDPEHSIVDVAAAAASDDDLVLKTYLSRHSSGLFVVPGPPSPELADEVNADSLGRAIRALSRLFRYVIVDTTPGLGEHTLAAIENVTDAVFVSSLSIGSLRAMRKELELLLAIGLMPTNQHVVLNFFDQKVGLAKKDAENIIGARVNVVIPRSTAVALAANSGVPLVEHSSRDVAAKAMVDLAARVDSGLGRRRRQRKGEKE